MAWDYSPDYVQERQKWEFDYSRKLGFTFSYFVLLNQVPKRFKETHPEYKYIRDLAQIHPSDPFGKEITTKLFSRMIKKHGTDHMYGCGVMGEEVIGQDPTQFKIDATLQLLELLNKLDPDLEFWRTDSWSFFYRRDYWTPKEVKRYLDALPDEHVFITESSIDVLEEPMFEKHNFYHGKKWAFIRYL